jgi:hypothetical protein
MLPSSRRHRYLEWGTVVASGITLALAAANITVFRLLAEKLILSPNSFPALAPDRRSRYLAEIITRIFDTRQLTAWVLIVATVALSLTILRRSALGMSARLSLVGAIGLLVSMVSVIVRDQRLIADSLCHVHDSHLREQILWERITDANQALHFAKLALVGLAIVSIVWLGSLAVRDAKRGALASRGRLFAATGVLTLGVVAGSMDDSLASSNEVGDDVSVVAPSSPTPLDPTRRHVSQSHDSRIRLNPRRCST